MNSFDSFWVERPQKVLIASSTNKVQDNLTLAGGGVA
jgi:hypothetical protein